MTNKHKVTYYLNPLTGRVIKSTSKKFKELVEKRGWKTHPRSHSCFYNIKSAERCLNRLLRMYPGLVRPPSSFMNIPRTYQKGPFRGFIVSQTEPMVVIGAVDKHGNINRTQTPVKIDQPVPIIQDPFNAINIKNKPVMDDTSQEQLQDQVVNDAPLKPPQQISLIYNPVFNDIVPVNEAIDTDIQKEIIGQINKDLVPLQLPPINEESSVAGLVKHNDSIVGVVNTNNEIQPLPSPIPIQESQSQESQTSELNASQSEAPETSETQTEDNETQSEASETSERIESLNESDTRPNNLLTDVSSLPILEVGDNNVILEQIKQNQPLSETEANNIIEQINCLDGEQFDTNSKRCLPCSQYNLEWDDLTKKCIIKIEKPTVVLSGDHIIGYLN